MEGVVDLLNTIVVMSPFLGGIWAFHKFVTQRTKDEATKDADMRALIVSNTHNTERLNEILLEVKDVLKETRGDLGDIDERVSTLSTDVEVLKTKVRTLEETKVVNIERKRG